MAFGVFVCFCIVLFSVTLIFNSGMLHFKESQTLENFSHLSDRSLPGICKQKWSLWPAFSAEFLKICLEVIVETTKSLNPFFSFLRTQWDHICQPCSCCWCSLWPCGQLLSNKKSASAMCFNPGWALKASHVFFFKAFHFSWLSPIGPGRWQNHGWNKVHVKEWEHTEETSFHHVRVIIFELIFRVLESKVRVTWLKC